MNCGCVRGGIVSDKRKLCEWIGKIRQDSGRTASLCDRKSHILCGSSRMLNEERRGQAHDGFADAFMFSVQHHAQNEYALRSPVSRESCRRLSSDHKEEVRRIVGAEGLMPLK